MDEGIFYTVRAGGLEELAALAQRFGPVVEAHLRQAMQQAVNALKGAAVQNAPVGVTGNLRRAVFSSVEGAGGSIRGVVAVGPAAPYGICVEGGTRPHFPPLAPIRLWVERKLGVDRSHSWIVAKAIQTNIGLRGTQGQGFFKRAVESEQARINAFFDAALSRALEAL